MRRSSEEVDPASRTSSTAAQRSASRGDRVARQHQDGLAPLVVQGIFDIIRAINQQGVTVLLIEQNANMALKIADYAYVLETGNITKSGTGAELLADDSIKEAYLGKKRS